MEKKLVIKNKKDLEKFLKRIYLYRSILYSFVKFKIEESKYDIKNIVNALNIKNRKKRIEYIYDSACDEIDSFYSNKNMCGFKNNQCYVQRKLNNGKINGCCRMCVYQSSKGCLTKNLTCKLFFCSEVKKRHKVLTIEDVKVIKVLGHRQRYILKNNYFSSRKQVITDLYLGSLTIVLFRYGYRVIRNFLKRMLKRV